MARARLPGLHAQLLDEGNPTSISMENALRNCHVAPRPRRKLHKGFRSLEEGSRDCPQALRQEISVSCARSVRPVIAYLSWTEFKGGRGNKALANTPWEGLGRRAGGHQSFLQSPTANSKHRFLLGSVLQNQRVSPQNSSRYLEVRNKDSISRSRLPTSLRSQTNVDRAEFWPSQRPH